MSMTKAQCIAERNHREMILHPEWWADEILPLKRRKKNPAAGEFPWDTGYVLADDPATVINGNVFMKSNNTSSTEYNDVDELLADGWEVD